MIRIFAVLALALAGGTPSIDWWTLMPITLFASFMSGQATAPSRRMTHDAPDHWELKVGERVPEIELPTRGGEVWTGTLYSRRIRSM